MRESLHHRVDELERRLIGETTLITTLAGRKVLIRESDAPTLMLEAWNAVSRTYSLGAEELSRVGISERLTAVADAEFNPSWPNALQLAHGAVSDNGKHVGLKAVMEFLRTKVTVPERKF